MLRNTGSNRENIRIENDIILDPLNKPITYNTRQESDSTITEEQNNLDKEMSIKKLNNSIKVLEANMNMYLIYDNYDTKNKIILEDLKKKQKNQEKELKKLIEDRDKLKLALSYNDDKGTQFKKKSNILGVVNIILLLLLIASIVLIIYTIYTYDDNILLNEMYY